MNKKKLIIFILIFIYIFIYFYRNSVEHDFGHIPSRIHAGLESAERDNVLTNLNTAFVSSDGDILIFQKNGKFIHFVKSSSISSLDNVIEESGKWKHTSDTTFYIKNVKISNEDGKIKAKRVNEVVQKFIPFYFDYKNIWEAKIIIDSKTYALLDGFSLNSSNDSINNLINSLMDRYESG